MTKTELTDKALRELLQKNLPERMPSPWFTRKVLNRLPPPRYRLAAFIEYVLYIAGIITAGIMSVQFVIEKTQPGAVTTVGDLSQFAIMVGVLGILITMFITSLLLPSERSLKA